MLELACALPPEQRSVFVSFSEGQCRHAFLREVRTHGFDGIALRRDTPHFRALLTELTTVLRGCGATVLCCHGYKADVLGCSAVRRLRIPAVAVSRGWTAENLRVRLYEMLDRRVLRWMDRVVCVSEGQAVKVRLAGRGRRQGPRHSQCRPRGSFRAAGPWQAGGAGRFLSEARAAHCRRGRPLESGERL